MEKLLTLRYKLENEMKHSLNSLRSTLRYDSLISKTLLHGNITVDYKQNFLHILILYKFIIVTLHFKVQTCTRCCALNQQNQTIHYSFALVNPERGRIRNYLWHRLTWFSWSSTLRWYPLPRVRLLAKALLYASGVEERRNHPMPKQTKKASPISFSIVWIFM